MKMNLKEFVDEFVGFDIKGGFNAFYSNGWYIRVYKEGEVLRVLFEECKGIILDNMRRWIYEEEPDGLAIASYSDGEENVIYRFTTLEAKLILVDKTQEERIMKKHRELLGLLSKAFNVEVVA